MDDDRTEDSIIPSDYEEVDERSLSRDLRAPVKPAGNRQGPMELGASNTRFQWAVTLIFATALGALFAQEGPKIVTDTARNITKNENITGPIDFWVRVPYFLLGTIVGSFVASLLIRYFQSLGEKWRETEPGERITLMLGAVVGLLVAVTSINIFTAFISDKPVIALLVFGIWVGSSAALIYAMETMQEVLPWYKNRGPVKRTGMKILDTNVIIDGRIYDVARTGFIEGQLYVPGFVLEELQYIADSHDPLRRQRGKRGLEVLRHLQADFEMEVRIHDHLAPDAQDGVDSRLVRLAKAVGGDLVTNDHNLNRVATLQDVRVLNLNDLSLSLRPNVLPQERLALTIVREGNQIGQGIGYLDDGTMVVVENGQKFVGQFHEVVVTQVIQTERGKLIFAEIEGEEKPTRKSGPRRGSY